MITENRTYICTGRQFIDGKLYLGFIDLTDKKERLFDRKAKNLKHCLLGSVYRSETTIKEGGGVSVGQMAFTTSKLPDGYEEQSLEWEVRDRLAWNEAQAVSLHKKSSELEQALAPVKKLYDELPFGQRTMFQVMILDMLRRR